MSPPSFNVLTEPWIPVIGKDGSRKELGILPCLSTAHELREIRDPSPMIEFGLYRLLVAFMLDCLISEGRRPEVTEDLEVLLKSGEFNGTALEKYAADCGDVFDLFHPARPFLQTAMMDEAKSVAALYPLTPSGTNSIHWFHLDEAHVVVSPVEAARLLTTLAPFATKGGRGYRPSINQAPPAYALPSGSNLFETILLNIPLRCADEKRGKAAWNNSEFPGNERNQTTMVEALTWRPRQVQLLPKTERLEISQMRFENGDYARLYWIDPNLAYQFKKDKVSPVRMREDRPIWLDTGPLALLHEVTIGHDSNRVVIRRPDVVAEAFNLRQYDQPLRIMVYAIRTKDAKCFEWARSTLDIPAEIGRSTRLGHLVHQEFERAERVEYALRSNIRMLYTREGVGNKTALGSIVDRCSRAYWHQLESCFQSMMHTFTALDPDTPDDSEIIGATAKSWREAIHSFAIQQFEFAAQDMDTDGDALKRQVKARDGLRIALRKALL